MYPEVLVKGSSFKRLIFGSDNVVVTKQVKGVLTVDNDTLAFLSCPEFEINLLPVESVRSGRRVNFASKFFDKVQFLSNREEYIITFDPPEMLVYDSKRNRIMLELEGRLY
jgi:hypothetical protein